MKTNFINKNSSSNRNWWIIDAKTNVLGKIATTSARLLQGKHKSNYTPNFSGGDYVIITNAAEVYMSGKKHEKKNYYRHTGYPGGLVKTSFLLMKEKQPISIVLHAIKGMLPKNKNRKLCLKRLKIYNSNKHPHLCQNPKKSI